MEFNLNINQPSIAPNMAYKAGQPEAQAPAQPQAEPVPPLANAGNLAANPAARNLQEYSAMRTPQGPIDHWTAPEYQPIQPGEPYIGKLADEVMNSKKLEILLKHARENEELGDFKDAEKAYKTALKWYC